MLLTPALSTPTLFAWCSWTSVFPALSKCARFFLLVAHGPLASLLHAAAFSPSNIELKQTGRDSAPFSRTHTRSLMIRLCQIGSTALAMLHYAVLYQMLYFAVQHATVSSNISALSPCKEVNLVLAPSFLSCATFGKASYGYPLLNFQWARGHPSDPRHREGAESGVRGHHRCLPALLRISSFLFSFRSPRSAQLI